MSRVSIRKRMEKTAELLSKNSSKFAAASNTSTSAREQKSWGSAMRR